MMQEYISILGQALLCKQIHLLPGNGFSKNQEGPPLASSMAETDTSLVLIQRQCHYWKLKFVNPSTDN